MKQKNYYDELSIQLSLLEEMDILTVSGGNDLKTEGEYDDGSGWSE